MVQGSNPVLVSLQTSKLKAHNIKSSQHVFMMPTIELRVGIHCDKCVKEIKRAVRRLEGVETYKMDTVQQKMTVTGDVTAKQVIKTLVKSGKPAYKWDDYPTTS